MVPPRPAGLRRGAGHSALLRQHFRHRQRGHLGEEDVGRAEGAHLYEPAEPRQGFDQAARQLNGFFFVYCSSPFCLFCVARSQSFNYLRAREREREETNLM
uniref:(northern house mosquito) hypothetical protein n=1 Tax=Culex pipiens TaxID=7175 RepID=A0A8D8FPZ9_CULPI